MRAQRLPPQPVLADGLDRPTSLEFIRKTAYVVTLTGEIWKFNNLSRPRHTRSR